MVDNVTRTTLANGLTVVLREVHNAPVASSWLLYHIGSRNEPTGKTGISHWVEHMMFKGTQTFPQGTLDKEIDRNGGQWNAFTSMDYTMYYETLPADRIELALRAEADRMVNAQFDPDEVERERTVIISERQDTENEPLFWLQEAVRATAFFVHGYGHEIIGDMVDLHTMTRDDLYEHYRRHYTPSNATLVVVGDFDTQDMLALVEKHFAPIVSEEKPNLFVRPEPPQQGERRVIVERPGETAFLELSHRSPAATEDDWFALQVLDSALSGPGGGISNKTSRLYQALVKSEIAVSVTGQLLATIDPYLYSIIAVLRDGRTPQEAEAIIVQEIEKLCDEGITEQELIRAKKQARAGFAYSTESMTSQAYWLARSYSLGDPDWFTRYTERLQQVTLEDVREVARRYLRPQSRTVGWLIPTGAEA